MMDRWVSIDNNEACLGSHSSKSVTRRVSKQVALAFIKRTLARCRKLEETGRSCFSEPALQDVIFSAPPCNNDVKSIECVGSRTASNRYSETHNHKAEPLGSGTGVVSCTNDRRDSHNGNLHRGSSDAQPVITYSSEQDFFKHELILNKGKKKEVLLDDVVRSASSKTTSIVGSTGHPSVGNFRTDRKSKTKPKQKMNNLSTSGNEPQGRLMVATNPASPSVCGSGQSVAKISNLLSREQGLSSSINIPRDSSKDEETVDFANLQLNEFEELGVSNGIGGNQDLSSWLNFDEDNLQEHDSIGLEIPPDDITDLHMFM